jgi:hypothetical protein
MFDARLNALGPAPRVTVAIDTRRHAGNHRHEVINQLVVGIGWE